MNNRQENNIFQENDDSCEVAYLKGLINDYEGELRVLENDISCIKADYINLLKIVSGDDVSLSLH